MKPVALSGSGRTAMDVASAAAIEAGGVLKAHFRERAGVRYKGRGNIVTDIDFLADKQLKSIILREFPDHSIISEETGKLEGDSGCTWILDPLDGTNNYSFGIPFFSTVVTLVREDETLLGVVYDPLRDELFTAEKGAGSFLNGARISPTGKSSVRESLIGFDLGYVDDQGRKMLEFIKGLWPKMYAFRIMGSAALGMAYAACARIDLYFHALLYPWELACGQLLVNEAGGTATDWAGRPIKTGNGSIIASSPSIHTEFLSLIREFASRRK